MAFELIRSARNLRNFLKRDFPFWSPELETYVEKLERAISATESMSDPDSIYALKLAKDVILALGGARDYKAEIRLLEETIAKAEKYNWREKE